MNEHSLKVMGQRRQDRANFRLDSWEADSEMEIYSAGCLWGSALGMNTCGGREGSGVGGSPELHAGSRTVVADPAGALELEWPIRVVPR